MMNEDARLLMLIWQAMGDYISQSDKQDAAQDLVECLLVHGLDVEDLYDADGECSYLDKALSVVHQAHLDEDADDEEEVEEGL